MARVAEEGTLQWDIKGDMGRYTDRLASRWWTRLQAGRKSPGSKCREKQGPGRIPGRRMYYRVQS